MALVETPGAATADTYGTLVEATAYFLGTDTAAVWAAYTTPKQEALLRRAVALLDAWPRAWTGAPVDGVQALGWPRTGMLTRNGFAIATSGATSITAPLKAAQFELAAQLGVEDRTVDSTLIAGIDRVKAGPVEVEFSKLRTDAERLALSRRDSLEAMIPDVVVMLLPPSWLLDVRDEDDSFDGFLFESLETETED